MDKQQTPPTKYVRITKQPEGENDWYRNLYRAKPIFEVEPVLNNGHYWDVIGTNYLIAKEDCEPYEFPTLPTDSEEAGEDMYQLANDFVKEWYPDYQSDKQQGLMNAFKAGYKEAYPLAFDRGFKQAQRYYELAYEGGHNLTDEQKSALGIAADRLRDAKKNNALADLMRAFPDVFKPLKQVIAVTDKKGTEYYTGEVMGILRTTKNKAEAYVIEHPEHGSELMRFLQETYDECRFSFDNYE
jgi:hypothetical protein